MCGRGVIHAHNLPAALTTCVLCGVTGMEEGILPGSRSLHDEAAMEEERRLAYVGFTRARKRLTLLHARKRTLWGPRTWCA